MSKPTATIPTITIEVDRETAKALAKDAAALGITIQDYLKKHFVGANGVTTVNDVDHWLDELSEVLGDLPQLPRNFSTKHIYADHD